MATIVKIKGSDGEVQYPITKPEAVIDENGKNILEIIQENSGGGGVSQDYVDTKVTELSAEVSGLSERIENLPTAESSVFEAVYGKTPFADMWAAYQANKHIICRSGNFMLSVVRATDTLISFSAINSNNVYGAACNSSNVWTNYPVFQTEKEQNKVTSLSDKSTDAQYPSAKAVYDFVNNTLGTIINGDY